MSLSSRRGGAGVGRGAVFTFSIRGGGLAGGEGKQDETSRGRAHGGSEAERSFLPMSRYYRLSQCVQRLSLLRRRACVGLGSSTREQETG